MADAAIPFENDEAMLREAIERFSNDSFATDICGIRIDACRPGHALLSLPITPSLLNAKGGVQGGALFALADLAAAVADYNADELNTTLDGTIRYLNVAKGNTLYAYAQAEKRGRTIAYYRVDISDDATTAVASAVFTYLHRPVSQ